MKKKLLSIALLTATFGSMQSKATVQIPATPDSPAMLATPGTKANATALNKYMSTTSKNINTYANNMNKYINKVSNQFKLSSTPRIPSIPSTPTMPYTHKKVRNYAQKIYKYIADMLSTTEKLQAQIEAKNARHS